MPGPERFGVLPAVRVVADPAALDAALTALETDRAALDPALTALETDRAALDAALTALETDRAALETDRAAPQPPAPDPDPTAADPDSRAIAGGTSDGDPAAEVAAALERATAGPPVLGPWWRYTARLAPDDLLVVVADPGRQATAVTNVTTLVAPLDPYAIVEPESAFVGAEVATEQVRRWMGHRADWSLPPGDGLSQGMVAALPVKIVVAGEQALVMAPASFAHELAERFDPAAADDDDPGGRR